MNEKCVDYWGAVSQVTVNVVVTMKDNLEAQQQVQTIVQIMHWVILPILWDLLSRQTATLTQPILFHLFVINKIIFVIKQQLVINLKHNSGLFNSYK
ncbi:MAG: hypothetical protein A2X19_02620 [Bacteroidetes bacterium GWE2_39_28]|nr:MAG: hypothetical protein A2X19_02620 [Bacteroidetes bacterium GWE2_39_28]OFY11882.1 MAG: hypothetical protein A2X16_06085 [Bacteroidetes bacterium GWF2_39_10]OFZ08635.1 MAG: hypothetical protein A2322_00835 [Bacteroidetes bacterium RIFOXYB2_FULL_39_7]OFZ11369.1 MAG: hypothetical protein A2465_09600 [Bacteroidetes bacterium RIFOXYC2_FULL_39_11]